MPDSDSGSGSGRGYGPGGTLTPIPDPSLLTTAQLDRATAVIERSMAALEQRFIDRFAAMDSERSILRAGVDRQIEALKEFITGSIAKLEVVTTERFLRIDTMFVEGDKRTQQLSTANALALAAALQAAKEAVGEQNRSSALSIAKSEAGTAESIRQLQTLFESGNRATNEKVDDLKSRLDKGEGGISSIARREDLSQGSNSNIIAFSALGVAVVMAVLIIVGMLLPHNSGSVQPTVSYVPAPITVPK